MAFTRDYMARISRDRQLLVELIKRSHREQNEGSYLGVLWNYFQPLAFIAVLYFIITRGGIESASTDKSSYGIYLVCGMVSWLFVARNLGDLCNVFKLYSYLIKKVDFDLRFLPLVKLVSAVPSHFAMILFAVGVALYTGHELSIHIVQLLYYLFATFVILFAIGLITASTSPFVKDVNNVVALLTQFGFWLTPIFWSYESMGSTSQAVLRMNPFAYLVEGYRDAIYRGVWFWSKREDTLIFWMITLFFLLLGLYAYKKLRPHIPEVL